MIPPVNRLPVEDQLPARKPEGADHEHEGPALLAVPTPDARAERQADGTLLVADRLSAPGLLRWLAIMGAGIRGGMLGCPVAFGFEVVDGDDANVDIPEGSDPRFVADALTMLSTTLREHQGSIGAFWFRLRCGCGVRVEATS